MRVIVNVIQFILQIQRQTVVCFLIIYLLLLEAHETYITRPQKGNTIQLYNIIILFM